MNHSEKIKIPNKTYPLTSRARFFFFSIDKKLKVRNTQEGKVWSPTIQKDCQYRILAPEIEKTARSVVLSNGMKSSEMKTAVQRRACARGSILTGRAPISRAKIQRIHKTKTPSRKISERNWNVHRNSWKETKVGKGKLATFQTQSWVKYGYPIDFAFCFELYRKKLYAYKTPWLTDVCDCF